MLIRNELRELQVNQSFIFKNFLLISSLLWSVIWYYGLIKTFKTWNGNISLDRLRNLESIEVCLEKGNMLQGHDEHRQQYLHEERFTRFIRSLTSCAMCILRPWTWVSHSRKNNAKNLILASCFVMILWVWAMNYAFEASSPGSVWQGLISVIKIFLCQTQYWLVSRYVHLTSTFHI
jgi:hypothetical protein